jgi:hypothetical protein
LFKKKVFLKDDEREMQDPVAKDLVYIQAVHDVVTSVYNVTQEEALKLAGLQVQVVYGDHNQTTHIPGFLTNNKDIQNFVPSELFPQRKPAAWEEAILKEHAKHRGVHPDEARSLYLNICRAFPLYGGHCTALGSGFSHFCLRNDAVSAVQVDEQQESPVARDYWG